MRAKDIFIITIAFFFLALPVKEALGTEIIDDPITADDYIYDTVLAVETAQIQLTDNLEEKVRILHRSSERLIMLVNQTNDNSKLNRLLNDYNERDSYLWEIWRNLNEGEADVLADLYLEISNDLASKRATLASNKFLPEQAQAGIAKAQENQEKALKNHNEALERAEENIKKAEALSDGKEGLPASPGQSESAPGRAGETPGLSGSTPGLSDSEPPGQAESTPGQSGSAPGLSDRPTENRPVDTNTSTRPSDTAPGQSGTTPGQSGNAPGQSESSSNSAPGRSGSAPGHNKDK